jgi:hypothetical protein
MHCRLCINCYGTYQWLLYPSPLTSRICNNLCKDDSALFSSFLHSGEIFLNEVDDYDLLFSHLSFYLATCLLIYVATHLSLQPLVSLLSHPSLYLATHLSTVFNYPSVYLATHLSFSATQLSI